MSTHSMIRCFLSASLMGMLTGLGARAQDGSLDQTFNPSDTGFGMGDGANQYIRSISRQPDGKTIIGGDFTTYNSTPRNRIARLNADGSLDYSFNPGTGANYIIASTGLQSDGKILIAGSFWSFNGTARARIARLNADGSLDTGFNPGTGADNNIYAIALQPDGKILIAGDFTSFNGTTRNRIARLNTDGSLDAAFDPGQGANGFIYCLTLQPDGKIIIGGVFTTYNLLSRTRITRLNSNGTLDNSFYAGTGANSAVNCINVQPDGKLIIGGDFTSFNGMARNRIARLNTEGSIDVSFAPLTGANGFVKSASSQSDGKVIIGGDFTQYNGTSRNRIARLNSDGSLDVSFNPGMGANGWVITDLQADNKIIIGGACTSYNGTSRNFIARLNSDGGLDGSFNPGMGLNNYFTSDVLQPDGKFIIAGSFTNFNGTARNYIARLNTDGSLDPAFDPGTGTDQPVSCISLQPDGKVIIGGNFTNFNGTARNRIARLNADGSLDATLDPGTGPDLIVYSIAVQQDGKVILGGYFTSFNGIARNHIARLNADGSLDASFNPGTGADDLLLCTMLQPDGKTIIAGNFTSYNGTARNRIARLNTDGSLDASFDPGTGANNSINSIALRPDGKIVLCGSFTSYNGTGRVRIARLNANGSLDTSFDPGAGVDNTVGPATLLPDGKIMIGGWFTSYNGTLRNHIARLNGDGSLDASFDPGTQVSANTIRISALQSDGKFLIGGDFTSFSGIGRNRIARLNGTPRAGIKLMLEGPYSVGTMNDALRDLPSFPLTEPFTAMGYSETGYVSGATIGSSVLSTTGNNAIVDWVLVEMRPVATPGTVAASRAVLLQRDGDVVDLDGLSTVGFAGLAAGNYCVAVKPRNHLPVMLSPTTPVSYGSAIATVDFTLPTTQVYDNDARKNVSGVMVLAAGDVSFNETIRYTGSGNDRDPILIRVGSTTPNNSVSGYWREDVNMDGVVKYTGSANDRDIILTNVGSITPNNTRVAALP